jgi:PIN domain nuclease of toxin-antitoxin system
MRLVADKHIWLWAIREPHKLTSFVHQAVLEPGNDRMQEDFGVWFTRTAEDLKLQEAPLQLEGDARDALYPAQSPRPGGRFLVATALAHDLVFVTADRKLMSVPDLKLLANVSPRPSGCLPHLRYF